MLKVWNLSLIVGAFALTTFGTFLTRGSILSSVHAFAQSLVGPMYLGFLVVVLVAGFGLIAARAWRLRSEGRFDSALSREAAFLGNNLVLLAVTFVVLLGTIFPLVVEALTNRQSTVPSQPGYACVLKVNAAPGSSRKSTTGRSHSARSSGSVSARHTFSGG